MQMASSEMMKVNWRRLLATACLAILPGVTILAGCGGGSTSSTDVVDSETETKDDTTQNSTAITDDAGGGSTVVDGASVPGAPTIYGYLAGDKSATVSFVPPASNGGAAILSYTVNCVAGVTVKSKSLASSPITVSGLTNGTLYSCSVTAANSVGTGTNSSSVQVTPASSATASSLTGHLYCPYSASVVNAGLNLTSTVSMTCNGGVRTMMSNSIPDHATGTFPNTNNPHSIKAKTVSFKTSLDPVSTGSTTAIAHTIGYANNGVKFDPATAEVTQNAGATWNVEALGSSFNFGTDSSNGHPQPDGTYHYHGMPEGYISRVNPGQEARMTLVGFANDGFPIYARWGYTTASNSTSAVKIMKSSYRLQAAADAGRPSTTLVPMGTFTQDYEYVAGLGDLDECNGRTGVTPEFPAGIYHYYITDDYPYVQRCIKGTSMTVDQ